jgi:hypothetical protein
MGTLRLRRHRAPSGLSQPARDEKVALKHGRARSTSAQPDAKALLPHEIGPGLAGERPLAPQHALALQRLAGNGAVARMAAGASMQNIARAPDRTARMVEQPQAAGPVVQRTDVLTVQRGDPDKREAKAKVSFKSLSLTGKAGLDVSDRLKLEVKSDALAKVPGISLGVAGEYLDSGAGEGQAKGMVLLGVGDKRQVFSVTSYGGAKSDGTLVFYVAPALKLRRFSCTVKGGPEHKKGSPDKKKGDETTGAIEAKCELKSRIAGTFTAAAGMKKIAPGKTPQMEGALAYSPPWLKSLTLVGKIEGPMSEPPINFVGEGADRTPLSPDKLPATRVMFIIKLDLPNVLDLWEKSRRRLPSGVGK